MNSIVGHKKQIAYFKNLIANKACLHAYLFEGTSGIGKKKIAQAISKAILCRDDQDSLLFDNANFSDFLLITPNDNEIKTDEVKKIHEYLLSAPLKAEKKIVLIDDAEKMNLIAQNKILKIIEEPPEYAMFFLITSNRTLLIDTLLSRLIRISFNALSHDELKTYLEQNNLAYDENAVLLSNGSIAKYREIIRQEHNSTYDFVISLIKALRKQDNMALFDLAKQAEQYKDNLYELLDALEFLSVKLFDLDNKSQPTSVEDVHKQAERLSIYLKIISETRLKYVRNLQKDLLISSLIYRMQGVFK